MAYRSRTFATSRSAREKSWKSCARNPESEGPAATTDKPADLPGLLCLHACLLLMEVSSSRVLLSFSCGGGSATDAEADGEGEHERWWATWKTRDSEEERRQQQQQQQARSRQSECVAVGGREEAQTRVQTPSPYILERRPDERQRKNSIFRFTGVSVCFPLTIVSYFYASCPLLLPVLHPLLTIRRGREEEGKGREA